MKSSTLMWICFAAVVTATGFFLSAIPLVGSIFLFWMLGRVYQNSVVAQCGSRAGWLLVISAVTVAFSMFWLKFDDWAKFFIYVVICLAVGAIGFLIASRETKPKEV